MGGKLNSANVSRLLLAKGLRAFGDGFVSLLLPLYLLELGFNPLDVGIIAMATLFGSGLLTLLVGLRAYRYHYRRLLLAATILMAGTGLGFALVTAFWPLLIIAVVGTCDFKGEANGRIDHRALWEAKGSEDRAAQETSVGGHHCVVHLRGVKWC